MELIQNYNNALQAIYNHVGFVEDWVIYPIYDNTEMFWSITDSEVLYAKTTDYLESEDKYYSAEIYEQSFYKKHVYEGKDLTLIFMNPNVDGMKYFGIFDNKKKIE